MIAAVLRAAADDLPVRLRHAGPGSPDRADAMVRALTELFEKERPEPRVRRL